MREEIEKIILAKYPNGKQFIENNKVAFEEIYKAGQLKELKKIDNILIKKIESDLLSCHVCEYVINKIMELEER